MQRPSIGGTSAGGDVFRAARREAARRRRRRQRVALVAVCAVAVGAVALAAVTPLLSRRPGRRATLSRIAGTRLPRPADRRPGPVAVAPPRRDERRVRTVPILMYHVINRAPGNA